MSDTSPIPTRLKEARIRAGFSQKELGIRAGIDEFSASPRVNQYEKGKHTPDYLTLKRLAEVLEVPVPFFLAEDANLAALIRRYGQLNRSERQRLLKSFLGDEDK